MMLDSPPSSPSQIPEHVPKLYAVQTVCSLDSLTEGRIPAHTIGSNFFHYNPDPWGSWIEWFSDIDQIDDCWVASDWDVPPHLWGAPPPETFLANREPAR
jgi:hypothetical protein